MIKNYFKIAWRNLQRNKAYAFISVVGLALGTACGILIFTLISYHLSFDNFHPNSDRVYRMYTGWREDGFSRTSGIPQPLGRAFRDEFSLAEKTARVVTFNNTLITVNVNKEIKKFNEEEGVAFADASYFDILNFPLVNGNKPKIGEFNEAFITENIAKKYFGANNAIGKVLRLDNQMNFTVRGILKDLPSNTDRRQEIYVSFGNIIEYGGKQRDQNWGGVYGGSMAFTRLKPTTTMRQVDNAIAALVKKNYTGRDQKVWTFGLQPLADVHFNSELGGYADRKYLWALFFIGLFLITTACVNFVNLATAQALNRSKEIGIRKVLGSLPHQLFWQFIAETALITVVAIILAIGLAWLGLPAINDLFQSKMTFNIPALAIFIGLMSVVVVFLSGSYPGLVLARFQPILALKSKLSQKHVGGFSLRRILVVTQFSISQVLIIGTIIIVAQLRFSQNADLGFNKKAVVLLPLPHNDKSKLEAMRNQLNQVQGVESISMCFRAPASRSNNTTGVYYDNRAEEEHWGINMKNGDDKYLSTFGLKLVAGRNFYPADSTREFLVNETFVKKMNLNPNDVIGKRLSINGKTISGPIVGVVKDFYNLSFHQEIVPLCIMPDYSRYSTCAIRIGTGNPAATLAKFEKIWNRTFPDELYSYEFLDDTIARFYQMDNILLQLVKAFAGIAILIGCLGLYGLVSFMAVRKTKEIGVRKVLGANIGSILWLFGKEFAKLLLIAFVIAAPLAWWAMYNYLLDFKYRITIGPAIFAISIIFTFVVASITVGYRSIVAALANPVKSLRSE